MDKLQFTNLLQIKEASQQGRLVLFVGAGVSNNSGVPTWSDLIRQMKDGCGADDETDDLKIAQLYKDSRGEKDYLDKVKEVLKYNSVFPNPIHKSILDLRPAHIITTNYDNLLEQEIQNEFKQFAIIKEDRDMPNMSYPNSLIKMHGDFDTNNIVLTESDYHNYQRNFPLIRSFVLSLFASKLVCFVGFSFADLNLKMILNDLRSVLHDSMQRVYLISDSKPSQVICRYYENKGINVVYLDDSDLEELLPKDHEDERETLTNPKGVYLHKVLDCIKEVRRDREQDLTSQLYSQLKEIKDEISVIGDGMRYFIPKMEKPVFNPHSDGLQLMSPYFKELHKQLKTFSGRKKFIQDHPNIDWRELKQIAYNNYLYSIDDVEIVDPQKQYELNISLGDFSALWYLYNFDFEKLIKRITYLSARDLTCDSQDLEYPFVLYKLGNYYDAYHEYNKILPLAWQRGKYILYFICLYNLWSIRNGVYVALMMDNKKLANKIHEKLSGIALDEVLGRLPVSEEIRKTFQDLLSFRSLGNSAVESEERRELIYQQRKSGERGGSSINSNIVSLLSKFDRTFQFCNNNYIICDNNDFYKSIAYNAICGMLNSYATPNTKFEGLDLKTSKISKLFTFCLFTLVFGIESKKLQEIFRRYEIKKIELTDEAIVTLNSYWENLVDAKCMPFVDRAKFENYIENLMYVTSKICTDDINGDNVYKTILKYWDMIVCFKIDGKLLAYLLSRLQPNNENITSILDKLTSNLETYERFGDCYEWMAHYLSKQKTTYDLDLSKLTEGKFAKELRHLYKIIEPSKQKEFSSYCQENLHQVRDYLEFIVDNQIDVLSNEEFSKQLESIENNPIYYKCDCYWLLSKMRHDGNYSTLHSIIDQFSLDNDCMKFFLNPEEYENKNEVDVEWILTTRGEGVPKLATIPEYKAKLKQYLIDNKFLRTEIRNNIVSVL
jgi:hypothetical protein